MPNMIRTLALSLLAAFTFSACTTTAPSANLAATPAQPAEVKVEEKPVPQDPALIITTAEVAALVKDPAKAGTFVLVDARPAVKYEAGHVPGAISIPKVQLQNSLDKLPKDKLIIFYCGGITCKLSPESAEIAMKAGFTNVKVWYEGEPEWVKQGHYNEVETKFVEKLVMKPSQDTYMLVDSRPAVKYRKSFIPTAVSIPNVEMDLKKGLLPADKSTKLIFYCGGYDCVLSHKAADTALSLGYKNVMVYAAGEPAWKDAGLPLWGDEASGVVKEVAPAKAGALPEAISPDEFKKLVESKGAQFIDVRDPEEFASGHIPGAINITEEDFIFRTKESVAKLNKEGRVVFYCATGGRSASSFYALLESEYTNKDNMQYLDAKCNIAKDGQFTVEK